MAFARVCMRFRPTVVTVCSIRCHHDTASCKVSGPKLDIEEVATSPCWNCNKIVDCFKSDKFFCGGCDLVQPPSKCLNYFHYLGFAITYNIDLDKLRTNYRKLQFSLHPDRFTNKSERERHFSGEQSTMINKAYWTLADPLQRAIYMLELCDHEVKETDTVTDPEFLMSVMELNEMLSDCDDLAEAEKVGAYAKEQMAKWQQDFADAFEKGDFDEAKNAAITMRYYDTLYKNVQKKLGWD